MCQQSKTLPSYHLRSNEALYNNKHSCTIRASYRRGAHTYTYSNDHVAPGMNLANPMAPRLAWYDGLSASGCTDVM